ncbi:hypothetical protein LEAN103870_10265 [Legionella anisa]|uniref:Uncharacterized protein n=1 Tax=Legionella anisa TaxID=28082 RepID=A0AAX0WV32_9GAMM|nr:hypothetical protein [Legionella anisa]AWN73652.1 hypothetical protein DLD14_07270 [Legionella anisa]KTC75768.1 hypothetical protein Lani_0591 [Legionella anisa]MBN5935594.1 hypothetical protein [Legionella anisa]MCW8426545.1 hypothetical protein [Legionella anisa]MCW8448208.1 hypothetical protein [Legionella anisa]
MIKKLLLCGVLSTVTLFSTTTAFAFYHSHHDYPRFKFHRHHHHSRWKNVYRWTPPPSVVVENHSPYPRYHQHY